MPLILGTNSIKDTGYDVANSLRFNQGSSDHLTITPGSAGNRRTFTISFWFKRSTLGTANRCPFSVGNSGSSTSDADWFTLMFHGSTNTLRLIQYNNTLFATNQVFRDSSAWAHIVIAVDTTDGTAGDRIKLYVNGSQVTSFSSSSNPSQNYDFAVNNTVEHMIGREDGNANVYFDGYLAEYCIIDGSALAPTSFGEFDEDSPTIWKPKDVSGLTFGTNGFYLEFKQSGTSQNSSGLGADTSGQDNHFAVNNLTAVDQSLDTCTNNACTLNPLYRYTNNMTYSEGNLKVVGGGNSWQGANSTFYINKGKWFFEVKFASATDVGNFYIGWTTAGDYNISEPYNNGINYYNSDGGEIYANGSALTTADYGTFANGDIMGMALDYDNSLLTVYKNGSALVTDYDFSSATTTAKGGNLVTPTVAHYGSGTVEWNFSSPSYAISSGNTDGNGYGNFEYSVPSGYYALNSKNLAEFG